MTIPELPSGVNRLRANWRSVVVIVLIATLAALLVWWVQQRIDSDDTRQPLATDSTRADGAQAAVTLARNQGTTVTSYGSWDDAMDNPETTVVVANWRHMSYRDTKKLADSAANLVLIAPSGGDLSTLGIPLTVIPPALRLPTALTADCDTAATAGVTDVLGEWSGLVITDEDGSPAKDTPGEDAPVSPDADNYQPCFFIADATDDQPAQYGLYTTTEGDRSITVIGSSLPFENQALARDDNAKLVLNLLTATDTVAWWIPEYVPSADGDDAEEQTQLMPPYANHVLVVLLLTFLFVWLWQGRRFGPIVREKMPVHVKSVEAMHGLATLYRRSGDADHAARLIRAGAKHRLSSAVGCGPNTADDVLYRYVADRIDGDADQITEVFTRDVHTTDQLHRLLADLNRLHAATEQPPTPTGSAPDTASAPPHKPGPSADKKVMT